MHPLLARSALATATLSWAAPAAAQAPSLPEITVTGNPLGATELIAPAASYSGAGLLLRSQTTLGETLSNTPGVASTYFGPNASRPVIRGLDGDRIRILDNGAASHDASSLSYDHAVAADLLAVERIEVLRGPAALLYGGNAIGGVVNLIDNRIPRQPLGGVTGRADVGVASGNREKGGALLVEGGNQRVGLHADVFSRDTRDVRVPVALACTRGGPASLARRICNSASEVRGGAVGGSLFFDQGYLGASASTLRNDYGAVAEDEVTIGLKSDRFALEGELRNPGGWLTGVKAHLGHTDYRHTEFDAGVPGTLFKNRGNDLRLEARHAKLGALEGVVGVQAEQSRFSADGDEAFAPYSRTRQRALFVHEELGTSWGKLTLGGRSERVDVESLGNPDVARFATGTRSFSPSSLALGALWRVAPAWQLTANLAHSERAPRDYELFANGPHVATGAYETGDPALGKERSVNADLGLQWKAGPHHVKVNAFQSRFRNYIALLATGAEVDVDGELFPELRYTPVRARFRGLEASGTLRLAEGGGTVELELRGDMVRALNLANGQPLPRIAPVRVGATLAWTRGAWGARLGFDHHAAQRRVPQGERETGAYTLWNAAVSYKAKAGPAQLLYYARLDNASNRLAYSATSLLTQTAPGRSPLPGRSLRLGVRADF